MSRSRVARSLAIWPWGWPAAIAAPASVASVIPATRAAAFATRDDSVALRASRTASIEVCIVCLLTCWNVMTVTAANGPQGCLDEDTGLQQVGEADPMKHLRAHAVEHGEA